MRRTIGLVLSGLGAFFIVLALALHFYVPGAAVKFPLNTYTISKLSGNDISYFSPSKLSELTGATLQVTSTTEGDPAAGSPSRAVYNVFTYIYDATNQTAYSYSTNRFAFDRRTGELLNCCNAEIGTKANVHMSCLGVLFPLGTKAQDYKVFNTTLLKPVTAKYSGQTTTDGISTYKFVTQIPATLIGTQSVPGTLVGSKQPDVRLNEYYQGTITDYVNPTTGVPVSVTEQQHIGLRNSSGVEKIVLMDGTLQTTPATVQSQVNTVRHDVTLLNWATNYTPLISGILGLLLLIIGAGMVISGRNEYLEENDY